VIMAWPLSQDYNEAIQNPASSFADPELKAGYPVVNALGMPLPRSGNFADVYEFRGASGAKWAIKCFTREVKGLRERYSEISKHLVQARLPFTVDFQYLEQGIRIQGRWFPVLKMHWVEGFLLNEFVRDNLDKPAVLDGLGQIWLRMGKRLREAGVAHADLQHGNVILVPGSRASALAVKLIDYDGMFVPALARKPSVEFGHPAYQHPKRLRQGIYSPEVDRLPLLAVACALRALAVVGRPLWERYDNGDNLLFREPDLSKPGESALFRELWNIPVSAVHYLTGYLALGLTGPLAEVPLLYNLVTDNQPQPLSAVEEQRVVALLGPGARVKRSSQVRPVLAQPVAMAAGSGAFPQAAVMPVPGPLAGPPEQSNLWESLAEEEGPVRKSNRKKAVRSPLIWLAAAAGVLVLLGVALGAFLLRSKDTLPPRNPGPQVKKRPRSDKDTTKPPDGKSPNKENPGGKKPPKKTTTPLDDLDPDRIAAADRHEPFKELVAVLKGCPREVFHVAFAPNERYVAATGYDRNTVCLWDLTRPAEPPLTKTGPRDTTSYPTIVAFSPDSSQLAFATQTHLQVWDVPFKKAPKYDVRIKADPYGPWDFTRVAYSPNGKTIALSTNLGVFLVDLTEQTPTPSLLEKHQGGVPPVAFSPDGTRLIGQGAGSIRLWDLKTKKRWEIRGTQAFWTLAVAPKGQTLAAGRDTGTVHVWDYSNDEPKKLWSKTGHKHWTYGLAFAPDGKTLVSSEGGTWNEKPLRAVWWNVADGRKLKEWDLPERCHTAAFSPSGYLALGCHDHKIYILRLPKEPPAEPVGAKVKPGILGRVVEGPIRRVQCLALSQDGRFVLSGSDTTAQLWDRKAAREIRRFDQKGYIFCLAISPKGDRILTGGEAGHVLIEGKKVPGYLLQLWDVDSGKVLRRFIHKARILSCAFSPDGRQALSGSGLIESGPKAQAVDCVMRLWDLETGQKLKQFSAHKTPVWQVKFTADGRHAFSRSDRLYFWDLDKTEPQSFPLKGGDLAFTSDGEMVIGQDPHGVRIHRRKSSRTFLFDVPKPVIINCTAISADNRFLLAGFGSFLMDGNKVVTKNGQPVYTDCTVRLYDLKMLGNPASFTGHEHMVTSVAISSDNRCAVSGDSNGDIRIWDLTKFVSSAKKPGD
jgi:WD40 repeat protein